MEYFLLFLILIEATFFFPGMLRFQIPWVTAVIFTGILLGSYGLEVVNLGKVMTFLAAIGLGFLMFTAVLYTKFSILGLCFSLSSVGLIVPMLR